MANRVQNSAPKSLTFKGESGATYTFQLFPYPTAFRAVGAIYALLRFDGAYHVVYAGQTGDLSSRFDDHHHEDHFTVHKVTNIAVLVQEGEQARRRIEEDIVRYYKPPVNETDHG
jgi:hypothetical protein